MTVKDAYLNIEQGLQNIAAFVYTDIQKPEMDLVWNFITNVFISLIFMSDEERVTIENIQFQEVQATLDDLRELQVKDYSATLTVVSRGKSAALPENYLHILRTRTIVGKMCNNVLQTRSRTNRILPSETIEDSLDNIIFKTSTNSPISFLNANELLVYNQFRDVEQFTIEGVYIDYLKKPAIVAYGVDGGDILELPDATCYKLIRICIKYLSIVSEQNQNKINNLKDVRN